MNTQGEGERMSVENEAWLVKRLHKEWCKGWAIGFFGGLLGSFIGRLIA